MESIKLLQKYKKKLSIYFALFLLWTIWLVVFINESSKFISARSSDEKLLHNKILQIENIIKYKVIYGKVEEITLKKIVRSVLEDSIVELEGKEVINFIEVPSDTLGLKTSISSFENGYIYLQEKYQEEKFNYTLIVRKEESIPLEKFLLSYMYFLLFSSPLFAIFYFLWRFLIGVNFRPVEQTMKNLEEFSANINHEFKTPLSEIISTLELSKRTKEYEKSIWTSIQSAKTLNKVLDGISSMIHFVEWDYSHERFDVVGQIEEILLQYKKNIDEKNIKVSFHPKTKTLFKTLNKEHFYICVSNIYSNAIKYSNTWGEIFIELSEHSVCIKDFWVGIDSKNIDKIFHSYFRENYSAQGTGLWLSIVKKITELHHWKITITSKKWQFTEMTLSF